MLDGLRGVAILAVMAGHLLPIHGFAIAEVAMPVFFGLSGFLITALLLDERYRWSRISLRHFFKRRALRLLPALVAFLAVWLSVTALFGQHAWMTSVPEGGPGGPLGLGSAVEGALVTLAYVTNWFIAYHLFSHYIPIGHLWSLSVEEQFYLGWAPVVAAVSSPAVLLGVALVLGAGSLAEPFILWHGAANTARIYFGTDTRAGAFLFGAAAAMLWRAGALDRLRRVAGAACWAIAGVLVVAAVGLSRRATPAEYLASWTTTSLAGPAFVVCAVLAPSGAIGRMLSGPAIRYVGKRSYALYIWHYVFGTWFRSLGLPGVMLTVACSFAAAEASWRLVESRALARKARLERARFPANTPLQAAGAQHLASQRR